MNALKNFTTGPVLSITICNSEHPLAKHASMTAKRIPGTEGMYYIRFKADKHVVTYRRVDHSIGLHEMGFAEFKQHWDNQSLPFSEAIDVPETDKYIGNVIWRLLSNELEPSTGDIQMNERTIATSTNTKVWCRRFEVSFDETKDPCIAENLAPTSVRRGAIALAAARASMVRGVADKRERILVGWLVAAGIIYRLDNNGRDNPNALRLDSECQVVWGKHCGLIRELIGFGWNARADEKSRPSITNMLLDAARGK